MSGDAGRLQQVIWNLLSNAVRFTPNDGRIDIEVARAAATLTITVRDTGPGIDAAVPAARLRALPPGRGRHDARARRPRPRPGDRPSPRRAARRLGRGDEQHAAAGRDVPHHAAGAAARGAFADARAGGGPGWRQPRAQRIDGVRVLVTDDDMNARELLAVILGNAGAEVRAAASAEDALMILQTWVPDVVLSDIEMPGEDGYGLIERVRRLATAASGWWRSR